VRGEVEYEVLPLADPEAVELFCLRSGLEADADIEQVCRRLDNMPLALELAAARTKTLTPEQILERLDERLDLFKGGRDAEERQRTLRGTIEWSHDLLAPTSNACSRGSASSPAAAPSRRRKAVADADLDTLQSLVEKSLARHTGDRFWMLETIREFAVERLTDSGEVDELQRRSATFLLSIGESANLSAESEGPERHELIRPRVGQLPGGDRLGDRSRPRARVSTRDQPGAVLGGQRCIRGRRRLAALLERGDDVEPVLRARALRVFGESKWIAGRLRRRHRGNRAERRHLRGDRRRTRDRRRSPPTRGRRADGRRSSPSPRTHRGKPGDEQGHARFKARGRCDREARSDRAPRREPGARSELFERSAILCEQVGFTWIQAHAILNAAELSDELDQTDAAEHLAGQGLRLSVGLEDRQSIVFALALLARLARAARGRSTGRASVGCDRDRGVAPPCRQWEWERDEVAQAIVIEDDSFESARREGRRLTLDEAVEYALAGRNEPVRTSGEVST
jgi:hypothetical protein